MHAASLQTTSLKIYIALTENNFSSFFLNGFSLFETGFIFNTASFVEKLPTKPIKTDEVNKITPKNIITFFIIN